MKIRMAILLLLAALSACPWAALAQSESVAPADDGVTVVIGEPQTAQILPVEVSVWIDAPLDEVWRKTILDIDGWWPHSYKTDSRIVFEPWAGGRVYEQFPGGDQGAIYGTVLYIEEGVLVKLDGQWGMPRANVSGGIWQFAEQDGGTLVTSKGAAMGEINPEFSKAREAGTHEVWLSLKHFIEDGVRVDRSGDA